MMSSCKILILCPHPDDEIFTFPFVNSLLNKQTNISALYFIDSPIRKREAKRSCFLNGWEAIFASDLGYTFTNGNIHLNYEVLNSLIKKLLLKYEIILSPVIEGGHQDHDTIGICTLLNTFYRKNIKVFYYPTYTSFGKFGLFSVMSKNSYSKKIFKQYKNKSKELPLKTFYHTFFIYKSQISTWIKLSIPYLFNLIKNKPSRIYTLKKNPNFSIDLILKSLNGKPLYEIHKRCKKSEWIMNVKNHIN